VREDWITLSDGCRLFARSVLPEDANDTPVPALLEYLPYRLSDGTAHRDSQIHGYFAGHGYAAVRVDMRGSGNSDGILLDEYLPQEQEDGCEVIEWLARQPWCTGAVGMFGKSWGGFNSLQIGARRPPALQAIVTAYFTDDRYADDVHYSGGCLLAHEALPWASFMHGLTALPPDPEIVGDRWREMWLERLERTPFYLEEWLRHQRRDAFWQQGSVCEDFSAVRVPTFLVGGWADGYTNPVARTLEGLCAAGVPCRALLGPWSHGWPQVSEPGPRIGFLQECLLWWDRWLKGLDNDAMTKPLLRVWMQEYDPPRPRQPMRSGRWVAVAQWPPPGTSVGLIPSAGGILGFSAGGRATRLEAGGRATDTIVGSELAGSDSGAWCPYGEPTDFPPDQRAEDGRALSYTTPPLDQAIEVLGFPEVTLRLEVDRPMALVAVRLCDVSREGSSLLVARGLLNLTHRESHHDPRPMPPDEPVTVRLRLDLTGHVFAASHRIRLSVSPTYWPFAWPSPEPVKLTLHLGDGTSLALPAPARDALHEAPSAFGAAEHAAASPGAIHARSGRDNCYVTATGESALALETEELSHLDSGGLDFGERMTRRFTLSATDPLSARVEHEGEHFLRRGDWSVKVLVRTSMSSTAERFVVTRDLDAFEGNARVHSARSSAEILRDCV
jgi:putative CocE/NonD family hydrolase